MKQNKSSERITTYVYPTKEQINEQCNVIHCIKKQDNGTQIDPKKYDLLCCGNIYLWF